MSPESATYLTNSAVALTLALLLTHAWLVQGRAAAMRHWMTAAWVFVAASVLFALRPQLPEGFGRVAPTLLVTVGHVALLAGARATAHRSLPRWVVLVVLAVHLGFLVWFQFGGPARPWRTVSNGVVWGGLALAAFVSLRGAAVHFWRPVIAPANFLLLHAAFHGLRIVSGIAADTFGLRGLASAVQAVGDLEASVFMVGLFPALLIAALQVRHDELSQARAEVQTLQGLLPICAWCKRVRDDAGYWQQVERYFGQQQGIRFTHGICSECAKAHLGEEPEGPGEPPAAPGQGAGAMR